MSIVKNVENFVESPVDDELLLMNVATGRFEGLKGVGLAIWRALDQHDDVARITADLVDRYDITPDECAVQVTAFLDELERAKFITRS